MCLIASNFANGNFYAKWHNKLMKNPPLSDALPNTHGGFMFFLPFLNYPRG
jgi:hypothetical protein